MHATFECVGFIASAVVKESKKTPGQLYGQIVVGCGTVSHEFFVEPEEVQSGKYKPQQNVRVRGTCGKRGYNASLNAESIEVLK